MSIIPIAGLVLFILTIIGLSLILAPYIQMAYSRAIGLIYNESKNS